MAPIGGIAMVPLAALLVEAGHQVTGSDGELYPPMSTLLESLQIPLFRGFSADHVPADCDAMIVGNAATRDNPEAAEAVRRGLPVLSLPQAVRQYLLPGKISIVITGTHGKTTTSALLSWLLLDSGRDPSFLVGGEMKNLGRGYRRGGGPHFVLEGDEYNAAFFDRGPKFLHYEPRHLFVGNIEFDHADLYPDLSAVLEAFRQVVALVPPEGSIVANADDDRVREALSRARAPIRRVSLADAGADFSARDLEDHPAGTDFTLLENGVPAGRLRSPLSGRHNRATPSARSRSREAWACRWKRSLRCSPALRECGGGSRSRAKPAASSSWTTSHTIRPPSPAPSKRRGSAGRAAASGRSSDPARTEASCKIFEEDYARAFGKADALVIAPVFHAKRLTPETVLDRAALVRRFAEAGKPAFAPDSISEIPEFLRQNARAGDVLILMSSGAFGGLPATLLDEL